MKDVVHTVGVKNIQFSEEKLKLYQKETTQDKSLKLIHEYYFNDWINIASNEHHEVKHFINFKNDIVISEGLIYYKTRLIGSTKDIKEKCS